MQIAGNIFWHLFPVYGNCEYFGSFQSKIAVLKAVVFYIEPENHIGLYRS